VVALDARTGKRRWQFQLVHHDLWDTDPGAPPQLTTIRHGRNRDVVVVTSKTTWLYVFDREMGEPIWPIEERAVPQSDIPGEESWPTQPYPTNPPPHSRQSFTVRRPRRRRS
jgi:quinoprotein glucose dehydrogenase